MKKYYVGAVIIVAALTIGLFARSAFGATLVVRQHVVKVQNASGTTCPITITSSLAGSVLTIAGFSRSTRAITGVTDNQGNTWVQAAGAAGSESTGLITSDNWYVLTPTAGVTTITVAFSGAAGTDNRDCEAWEVTGFITPGYDTGGHTTGATGVGTTDNGPSLTMTGTKGFSWAATNSGGSTAAFPKSGNEYTAGGDLTSDFVGGFASLIYAASGTHQPVALDGGSGNPFLITAAAIKETAPPVFHATVTQMSGIQTQMSGIQTIL